MELRYPELPLADGDLALRSWAAADVPCIQAATADPGISVGTTVPTDPDAGEALAFIIRQHGRLASGEGVSLAVTEAGEAVGLVYLGDRPEPEVLSLGYWLVPAARGRGLAHRAVRLATDWAFSALGAARIEAWVEPQNAASRAVMDAAGFTFEGVLRSYLMLGGRRADVRVYSRLPGDA